MSYNNVVPAYLISNHIFQAQMKHIELEMYYFHDHVKKKKKRGHLLELHLNNQIVNIDHDQSFRFKTVLVFAIQADHPNHGCPPSRRVMTRIGIGDFKAR